VPKATIPLPEAITPTTWLRLEVAAALAFPEGSGITKRTLYNEIDKGNLPRREFGGKLWLTLNDIKEAMRNTACAEQNVAAEQSPRGSISANRNAEANPSGSSSTERSRSARAHLSAMAQRLRKRSTNTSGKNTSLPSAQVIQLKS
jgi:hypothetical protein